MSSYIDIQLKILPVVKVKQTGNKKVGEGVNSGIEQAYRTIIKTLGM